VTLLEPQALSNLWYLRFGNSWIRRDALDKDWKPVASALMQGGYMEYELMPTGKDVTEILKLKG
jgi:hypothetical protein